MTTEHDDTGIEPPHTASPTDHVLAELQLYGYRPFQDEPDPRPLPEAHGCRRRRRRHLRRADRRPCATPASNRTSRTCSGRPSISFTAPQRMERELDDNEQAQRRSQKEQDGSEIRSVELERLTARRSDADRAQKQHGILPRPGRRPVRAPHRLILAAALGLDGQPPHADLGHDRQPGFPCRQAPGRNRGAVPRRAQDRLHRRARLQRSSPDLGQARQGPRQASRHGAAAWWIAEGRRTSSPPAGPTTARCRKSPSSPTGRNTPRPRRSNATIRCFTCCRSGSWCSLARASKTTSPTRHEYSASRFGGSARAARERCQIAADKFSARQNTGRKLHTGLGEHERPSPHKISPKGAGTGI